jgi:predicted GIY-YIG superfamily endonuclease
MQTEFDIIQAIEEECPVFKNKPQQFKAIVLNKIKKKFEDKLTFTQQNLYVASLYAYQNYHQKNDFVIDFDRIWKWCKYSRKSVAKSHLTTNLKAGVDYKILLQDKMHQKTGSGSGGHNKETIMLNIRAFKKFCLSAQTEKAPEIHDYYIDMEEIHHEMIAEEQKHELQLKDNEIERQSIECERNLIVNAHLKKVVYLGLVEDNVVKFGYSRDIRQRVQTHKCDFDQFKLKHVIETESHVELEIAMKEVFKERRISKVYKNKNQTELIQLDDEFTLNMLYEEIRRLLRDVDDNKDERLVELKRKNEEYLDTMNKQEQEILYLKEELRKCRPNTDFSMNHRNALEVSCMEYLKKFLMDLYEKNKGKTIWYQNQEIFEMYKKYVTENYDEMYVYDTPEKLASILKSCRNAIQFNVRRTLKKTDPNYKVGSDNRVNGKKIYFNDAFKEWMRL